MAWTILEANVRNERGDACYRCECACGTVKLIKKDNIDHKKSTGCQRCHLKKVHASFASKLTDDQIAAIRASTGTNAIVAERFGISDSYASRIRRGVVLKR